MRPLSVVWGFRQKSNCSSQRLWNSRRSMLYLAASEWLPISSSCCAQVRDSQSICDHKIMSSLRIRKCATIVAKCCCFVNEIDFDGFGFPIHCRTSHLLRFFRVSLVRDWSCRCKNPRRLNPRRAIKFSLCTGAIVSTTGKAFAV